MNTARLFGILRNALWIGVVVVAASVYASRMTPLADQLRASLRPPAATTILPARIGPGFEADAVTEFAARAAAVQVAVGAHVEAGDILAVLESPDLAAQLQAAEARLAAAVAHLDAARTPQPKKDARPRTLVEEQMRSARRSREMAVERLQSFRLDDKEAALRAAGKREKEIRTLVSSGLATDAELESVRLREESARRELENAREHTSRLKQDVEQADAQIRLIQIQSDGLQEDEPLPNDTSAAEADLVDAQAALSALRERAKRLVIMAPHSGTVLEVSVREGEWLPAGTRLARMADLSALTITAPVTGPVAQMVRKGRAVTVHLPGEAEFAAVVDEVALVPNVRDQAYEVRVKLPNPDPDRVLIGLDAGLEFEHLKTSAAIP